MSTPDSLALFLSSVSLAPPTILLGSLKFYKALHLTPYISFSQWTLLQLDTRRFRFMFVDEAIGLNKAAFREHLVRNTNLDAKCVRWVVYSVQRMVERALRPWRAARRMEVEERNAVQRMGAAEFYGAVVARYAATVELQNYGQVLSLEEFEALGISGEGFWWLYVDEEGCVDIEAFVEDCEWKIEGVDREKALLFASEAEYVVYCVKGGTLWNTSDC